jgi:excisionase family DNA binding protein
MKLIETLKSRTGALKVAELAKLFGVTPQHIYRMAANGSIPSFRIAGSVRFDPDEIAAWLGEKRLARRAPPRRFGSRSVAA